MPMEHENMLPKEVVFKFLHQYFEERNLDETLNFFTDDVNYIGTGINESAIGINQLTKLLYHEMETLPQPFKKTITFYDQKEISPNCFYTYTDLIIQNSKCEDYQMGMRLTTILRNQNEQLKICSLHASVANQMQNENQYFPFTQSDFSLSNQLKDANKELSTLISCSPGGVLKYHADGDGSFSFVSENLLKLLGYTQKEFIEKFDNKFANMVYFKDRKRVLKEFKNQIQVGSIDTCQYRVETKSGELLWFYDVGKLIIDEDGIQWFYVVMVDITQQKSTNDMLDLQKSTIKLAMEQTKINFWIYDLVHNRITIKNDFSGIMGKTGVIENVSEYYKTSNLIHPDDKTALLKVFQDLYDGKDNVTATLRWKHPKTNEYWWGKISYTNIFDENHKPIKAIGSVVDVTEQKALEDKYNKQISYKNIVDQNVLSSFHLNLTRNLCGDGQCNFPYLASLKNAKTVDEFFRLIKKFIPTEKQREEYSNIFNRQNIIDCFWQGETHFSFQSKRSIDENKIIWISTHINIVQNPNTNDIEAVIYTFDINQQKMLEELFETVISTDYDYVIELNAKLNSYTMYFSETTHSVMPNKDGDNYEAIFACYCNKYVADDDINAVIDSLKIKTIKTNLENNKTYAVIVKIKNTDGAILVKKLQFSYIDKQNELILLTRLDITELFEDERQKSEALNAALISAKQANAAKTDFLSRMSHEIRTPMNAIIGMSTLAAQSIGNDEQVAECISKIGISSRFLLSLINDILDMSRIESGKMLLHPEKFSLVDMLSNVNSICYTQAGLKNIDYECIIDSSIDDYYIGDCMKLQQVIINVLSNAVKFTPYSGKVSLTVKKKSCNKKNAQIRFVINDTGCGISDEFLPHIFDAFSQENTGTTTRYGGTGLGLAICKNLVSLMDGTISVRSIVGVGSEFTIDIKLGTSEETKQLLQQNYDYSHFETLKTLVVDDDPAVCEYTVNILKEMNVSAQWVDSGIKAVEQIKTMWSFHQYYNIVILDWKMPDMDGIQTAREIRKIVGPDVTIIIMTSYEWASIEHDAKLAGVNLFINKPMFKSTLISAFHKVLKDQNESENMKKGEFDFTGKRVLLVEDHPLNIEVATRLLEKKGFTVDQAENGVIAIEKFATAPVGYYDAILMDIRMPVMDGLQASTTIRHLNKETAKTIPIIAMTANAFDEDIQKSKNAGMNAHLAKPIEPNLLYGTLDYYINQSCK